VQECKNNTLADVLNSIGLKAGMHVIVHSGFRALKSYIEDLQIEQLIDGLQNKLTKEGSLIMPAFSYNFRKSQGDYELFDRINTKSDTGAVAEVFRKTPGVIRTSAASHSFSLWGAVTDDIKSDNAPRSSLGRGSVLEWLTETENGFVLMLGTNFTSLSYIHYLETVVQVPWVDVSPWEHQNILKIGASLEGDQELHELPGCSKGFQSFEQHLLDHQKIEPVIHGNLKSYLIPIKTLYNEGRDFLVRNPEASLCEAGKCKACDVRWEYYLKSIKSSLRAGN